jgi:hypothetical protein
MVTPWTAPYRSLLAPRTCARSGSADPALQAYCAQGSTSPPLKRRPPCIFWASRPLLPRLLPLACLPQLAHRPPPPLNFVGIASSGPRCSPPLAACRRPHVAGAGSTQPDRAPSGGRQGGELLGTGCARRRTVTHSRPGSRDTAYCAGRHPHPGQHVHRLIRCCNTSPSPPPRPTARSARSHHPQDKRAPSLPSSQPTTTTPP